MHCITITKAMNNTLTQQIVEQLQADRDPRQICLDLEIPASWLREVSELLAQIEDCSPYATINS